MPVGRHTSDEVIGRRLSGLSRRRFLRAAGVGTAGAVIVGTGATAAATAEVAGGTQPAAGRRLWRSTTAPQRQAGPNAVAAVSGPLAFHTITPLRYIDTRFDGLGPFPPNTGFIVEFGAPFTDGTTNEVAQHAEAIACNLTVTSGTRGGNLRLFPADAAFPTVSNLNWTAGQTVANYAIAAAANSDNGAGGLFQAAVVIYNASSGSVHVIVDVSGFFV
jgi:hypothetical protein